MWVNSLNFIFPFGQVKIENTLILKLQDGDLYYLASEVCGGIKIHKTEGK